jgi:hypothetical protein
VGTTYCVVCRIEEVAAKRVEALIRNGAGFITCLRCGEADAKKVRHTIVPMHKSNYVVVSDRALLKCLNKVARG